MNYTVDLQEHIEAYEVLKEEYALIYNQLTECKVNIEQLNAKVAELSSYEKECFDLREDARKHDKVLLRYKMKLAESGWEKGFDKEYPAFRRLKLEKKLPPYAVVLLKYMTAGLTNIEYCFAQGLTTRSAQIYRGRIKKWLELGADTDLRDWITHRACYKPVTAVKYLN